MSVMIELADKKDCCGCTACASICSRRAITMVPDGLGFMYPEVAPDSCIRCGRCVEVCQFHSGYERYDNFASPQVYGCRHKDIRELLLSQSGAASWALIQAFLSKPGVVYGVGYDTVTHIVHKRATTINECREFRGSKYVQSDLRGILELVKKDLRQNCRVLFFGTACQVSGLKSYIPKQFHEQLFTVDLICHSVGAPAVMESYVKFLEKNNGACVASINFRDKQLGWHSHEQTYHFTTGIKKTDNIFFSLYYDHLIIRKSCTNCPFTNFARVADITLADFWGWEKYYSEWNDNKGVSLFLVNSPKGERMHQMVLPYMDFMESDFSKCVQPQLQHPAEPHWDFDKIENLFIRKGFAGVAKRYGLIPGYVYYKNRLMPYVNAGKRKILRLLGLHI